MVQLKDITDFTVLRLLQNGVSVTPLKLQKILYYIQAWHMVYFNGDQLFTDVPEAWVNGPVYRNVYTRFKSVGIYTQILFRTLRLPYKSIEEAINAVTAKMQLSGQQHEFLESIYHFYGTKSHDELVFLTHSEEPWNKARQGLSPLDYADNTISLATMRNYYANRLKR